jgi:hypothetical protein
VPCWRALAHLAPGAKWARVSGRVSWKSMKGKTPGVRKQFAQGDSLSLCSRIVGDLSGNKLCIHICVQS